MTISPEIYHRNHRIVGLTIPCQSAIVVPAAHIYATDISVSPMTCTEPCTLTVNVTYINDGTLSGTFDPKITYNGNFVSLPSITLNSNDTSIQVFTIDNLGTGNYTICAIPDGTQCKVVTVSGVTTMGVPILLVGGLLFGFLLMQKKGCGCYKTVDTCPANKCQWKDSKCIPLDKLKKYKF
jgi:hypothetical protein